MTGLLVTDAARFRAPTRKTVTTAARLGTIAVDGTAVRRHGRSVPLAIRRAAEADLPSVLRLYAQPGMNDGVVLSIAEAAATFRRMAAYPDYALYVATSDDTDAILGSFALLIMDNLAHRGAPSAVVEDVCVDEGHRGQGIGRAMMTFGLDLARARGCYKLSLSSNVARPEAHAFYRALGFQQHGLSFVVPLLLP